MPLESATYIHELVSTNPVGASDKKQQGDDHLRLLKSTILATFANITGAVTATHTQLNQLASLAAVSVLGRSANSSGAPAAIAAGANDRLLRRVSDAVDFGQLTAGMFPNTVVPDAALSSNVPLKNAANTFSAIQTIALASTAEQVITETGGTRTVRLGINTVGYCGTSTNHDFGLYSNGTLRLDISAAGNFDFKGGTVTTNNASAQEVGFKGIPLTTKTADYTLATSDAGRGLIMTSSGDELTITSSSLVDGMMAVVLNGLAGSADLTIVQGSGATLYLAGVGTTGNRTVNGLGGAYATIFAIGSGGYLISGPGVS